MHPTLSCLWPKSPAARFPPGLKRLHRKTPVFPHSAQGPFPCELSALHGHAGAAQVISLGLINWKKSTDISCLTLGCVQCVPPTTFQCNQAIIYLQYLVQIKTMYSSSGLHVQCFTVTLWSDGNMATLHDSRWEIRVSSQKDGLSEVVYALLNQKLTEPVCVLLSQHSLSRGLSSWKASPLPPSKFLFFLFLLYYSILLLP